MQVHNIRKFSHMDPLVLITLCWSLGLCLGVWVGPEVSPPLAQFLQQACSHGSGFIVLSAVLPLVLIWLAFWRTSAGLLYPVLFLKAFMDGVMLIAISCAFGSSAWLVGSMLLLSDRVGTFVLLYISAFCAGSQRFSSHKPFVISLIAVSVVCLLDHLYISPFLLTLMP